MYAQVISSSESKNNRGYSMPRSKQKVGGSKPLMLQQTSMSPNKQNSTKTKEVFSNSNNLNSNYSGIKNYKHAGGGRIEGSNGFYNQNSNAHRSPVPIIKASPLTGNGKSYTAQPVKLNNNNTVLSASKLVKMHSAETGGYGESNPKDKNTLQKYHLEKRVSTSASSKVKSGESTCSSRNKTKFSQNTTDYLQLVNQRSSGDPGVPMFYQSTGTKKVRGKSSNPCTKQSAMRKSRPIEE